MLNALRSIAYRSARLILLAVPGLLAVGVPAAAVAQATAAKYDASPIDASLKEGEKGNKDLYLLKTRVLSGTMPFSKENQDELDRWYGRYLFPAMTQPENLGKLPEMRQEMSKDLQLTRAQNVHDHVVGRIRWGMEILAKGNYHPATRYNAMLAIGDLNAVERRGAQQAFPVPLPAALDTMMAELANPNQLDAVRVAALIGILRHAELDPALTPQQRIPSPKRNQLVQQMLAIVTAKDPPAGRSPAGHAWMQRRAIEILAALGAVGPVDEVYLALDSIVADENALLSLRCAAAKALGRYDGQYATKINPSDASVKLGALAASACRRELARMEEEKKREEAKKLEVEGAGGIYPYGAGAMDGGYASGPDATMMSEMEEMYSMSGMAPGMAGLYGGMLGAEGNIASIAKKPADPRLDLTRRRLKQQLVCIQSGLNGVETAATAEPHKGNVAKIKKIVEELLAATDPPPEEADLDTLATNVRKSVRDLDALTPKAAPGSSEPILDSPIPSSPTAAGSAPKAAATGKSAPKKTAAGSASGKTGKTAPKKRTPAKP